MQMHATPAAMACMDVKTSTSPTYRHATPVTGTQAAMQQQEQQQEQQQQQQQEQQSLHLLDLPSDMLGHIMGLLPDARDRRSFYASCAAVHTSAAVNAQLHRLRANTSITSPQLHFPRRAALRDLEIMSHYYDKSLVIFLLKASQHAGARERLLHVVSLRLEEGQVCPEHL